MANAGIKTTLLTLGTAFLSASTAALAGHEYLISIPLACVGIACFYIREIVKEEGEK